MLDVENSVIRVRADRLLSQADRVVDELFARYERETHSGRRVAIATELLRELLRHGRLQREARSSSALGGHRLAQSLSVAPPASK